MIELQYGQTNIFYPNSELKFNKKFPQFYHALASEWSKNTQEPLTTTNVLAQHVWNNTFLKIGSNTVKKVFPFDLFIDDLYNNGVLIPFEEFRTLHNLNKKDFFKWRQIISAIPANWKSKILGFPGENFTKDQHANFISRQITVENLTSKLFYKNRQRQF